MTYFYFFILLTVNISAVTVTYYYYAGVFFAYHFFFTFSKRFYYRTIVVIINYLNKFQYVKLILWFVFVLIPTLLGEPFIFLMVFNPLFAFSLATANFTFFFFLLVEWAWMFGLIFSNAFNIFNHYLLNLQNYFSRTACLHYIGNNPGKVLCQKIGTAIVCTPIVISLPATAAFVLDHEAKTANYAMERMNNYRDKHPDSTDDQQYGVYQHAYQSHGNSSILGRSLTNYGIMKPGAPEAVIPGYTSDLKNSYSDLLDKK